MDKLDFQRYRSENFVSNLSELTHIYYEVKTYMRNPGELLEIIYNIVTKLFLRI